MLVLLLVGEMTTAPLNLGSKDVQKGATESINLRDGKYFAPRSGKADEPDDLGDVEDGARQKGVGSPRDDAGRRASMPMDEIFEKVGPQGGGTMNRERFVQLIKKACPDGYQSDSEIMRLFDEVDTDGSGDLDFEEFEDWCKHDLEGMEVLKKIKEKLREVKQRRLSQVAG